MEYNNNYYNILGLTNQADISDIKKKYRKLAIELHPDKNNGDSVKEEKFKKISEAYSTLSDSSKKQQYDLNSPHGRNYQGGGIGGMFGDGMNINDIFNNIFNGGSPFGQKHTYQEFHETLDIQMTVVISLRDVYSAKPIDIKYDRNIHCTKCNGTGFDVDSHSDDCDMCEGSGVDKFGIKCEYCQGSGKVYLDTCKSCYGEKTEKQTNEFKLQNIQHIRKSSTQYLRGYGHQSKYFRDKLGTLILNVIYKKVKNYEIIDNQLYYNLNLHYEDAVNGNKIKYNHLDNKDYNINIPKGTNDKDIIKMKNMGLLLGNNRSDLLININIIIDYDRV